MQIRKVRGLMFGLLLLVMSSASFAQLRISVGFGPPALPVYEQPLCPGTATYGSRVIGHGVRMTGIISGFRELGWNRLSRKCYGRLLIGPGSTEHSLSMRAIGAHRSASTEELITASVTPEKDSLVGDGIVGTSSTTGP